MTSPAGPVPPSETHATTPQLRETNPVRYALGMFAGSLVTPMVTTYVAFYYVDKLGMSGYAYAGIMVFYAILDAIDNPVYGFLSDRTRTRWGRRRPWLVIAAPLLAISFMALFSAPGVSGAALVSYFFVFVILTESFDSMVGANYEALLPELFNSEKKRAFANSCRQAFQLVAMVISVALVPMIAEQLGYSLTAVILGSVAALVMVFCALGARENPANYAKDAVQPKLWDSIKTIASNKNFWLIAVANTCYASVIALLQAGVAFFVKYRLQLDGSNATYILGTVIVASAGFLFVWFAIIRRVDALKVWRMALVVLAASFVPMYFVTSLIQTIVAGFVIAIGYSGVIATTDLLIARLLDEDAAKHGVHREAIFTSAIGFLKRLSKLATSLAFLLMGVIFGYVSGDNPGPKPGEAARFLMVVMPFALAVVAVIISRFVTIRRRV